MPRRAGELRIEDTKDIEEGKLKKNCRSCSSPQIFLEKHARLADKYESNANAAGRTVIAVCGNSNCFRYADTTQLKSWQPTRARA